MFHDSHKKKTARLRKQLLYIAGISVIPFLVFAIIGYTQIADITTLDYQVGSFFYALREPMRTTIAIWITRLADREAQTIVTIVVTLVLLLMRKWRTGLWYGLTVLIGADFLNSFVKNIFQRVRPEEIEHLVEQGGYAYPSGHAMGSMIVYGGILFLLLQYLNSKRRTATTVKWLLSFFIGLLILAIGLSRIYLGVHYPSDVIGGFSLGLAWLLVSIAGLGLLFTQREFQQRKRNKYYFR